MADKTNIDSDSRSHAARAERQVQASHERENEQSQAAPSTAAGSSESAGVANVSSYPRGLLDDGSLKGRGNEPVRIALMQDMQQSVGNRALQRYLHAQRRANGSSTPGDKSLGDKIQSSQGQGTSLDGETQSRLEAGLGSDLSGVRVHTGSDADQMAKSVDAVAFTTGQDIFFREGAYNPGSQEGMKLLAHEATHTVQQSQGPVSGTPTEDGVSISHPSDSFEQAAEQAAGAVASGERASLGGAPSAGQTAPVPAQRQASDQAEEEDKKEEEQEEEQVPLQAKRVAGPGVAVQRDDTKKKDPPKPGIGWGDAPAGSPNAGETKQGAKGTILRIPLHDLPGGLQDKSSTSMAEEPADKKAIALVPASIANSTAKSLTVEVLLHLHGYGVGYRTRKTQLTNKPNSTEGTPVSGGEVGTARDISLDHAAEQLEASGRPMIGVLPQGDLKSGFGSLNTDNYIKMVFDALKAVQKLPSGVNPGSIVLSAHSGGGDRIIGSILGEKAESKQMAELVLFDAINREDKEVDEVTPLLGWLERRINKDLKSIAPLATDAEKAKWLRNNGFRFRAYCSASTGYTSRNQSLEKQLKGDGKTKGWLQTSAVAKALGGEGSEAFKVVNDENFKFIYTGIAEHERLIGDSKGIEDSLKALPPASGQAPAVTPTGSQAPKQQPAQVPAQPSVSRMVDPLAFGGHPAPVQRQTPGPVVPVQRDDHGGHESESDEPKFKKERVTMSSEEAVLVKGREAKPAKDGKPAEPGAAEIKESPATSTAAILKNVGKDAKAWFGDFTSITFLGRSIPDPVHIELAKHLKKVEEEFVAKFVAKPGNEKYKGKEKDAATIKATGDALGLSDKSDDFHGSRSSVAAGYQVKISMHMFGLAVDLNYTANPWVGQTDRNVEVTNTVFSRMGLLIKGEKMVYRHGLEYDKLAEMDTALEKYFAYIDKPDDLEKRLAEADIKAPWKGKTKDAALKVIKNDLDSLAGLWERGDKDKKEIIKKSGFMDFSKEFVEGMKLDWGGKSYGDMMHFDMRNQGIGQRIYDAIADYKREKAREAEKKYADEHPAPTKPAQPSRAPGYVPPVQRQVEPEADEDETKKQEEELPVQTMRAPGAIGAVNVQRDITEYPSIPGVPSVADSASALGGAVMGVASGVLGTLASMLGESVLAGAAGAAGGATDPEIEALNLEPAAKAGAIEFRRQHPGIRFTSGRRGIDRQASAMAANIVESGNRKWIQETYARSTASTKLQQWVDDHPEATTKAELAKGLKETLDGLSNAEKMSLSAHLSGNAFDVQPQTKDAEKIKADIRALPGIKQFLEKEGGLTRWHAQFKKASPSEQADDAYEREADRVAETIAGTGAASRPVQTMPSGAAGPVLQRQEAPSLEEDDEEDSLETAPPVQAKRAGPVPQVVERQALPYVQRDDKVKDKSKVAPKKPAQPFFMDAKGALHTVSGPVEAGKEPPKIPVGHMSGTDTYVTVNAKGKLGVPIDDALLGTFSLGGRFLRVKKVKVEEVKSDKPADASGMKEVTITPVGDTVGIEEAADGTFGGVVLKSSAGWLQKKNIYWQPADVKDWPSGTQSKLQSAVEPQIDLTTGFAWVLMDYSAKKGQASALHWVPSKHSEQEYEKAKESIEKETEKLPDNLKDEVEKNINIIASVSTVEGPFGAASTGKDTHASLGIFQWAQGKDETSAGGSTLANFFKTLKKRAAAAEKVEASKRTEEQKLYIQAWGQVTAAGIDLDSKGLITVKDGGKTKGATGAELEKLLSGTSGVMATGALRKYQLVAANDWINDVKGTVVRPGVKADEFKLIEKSYSEKGEGLTVEFKLADEKANYTFELAAPSDHATIADLLTDEKAIATAVSLGVNRPHFVETAMWLALTTGDPKGDVEKLMQQIAGAIEADEEKEEEARRADPKAKPKPVTKGKKPNVSVDAARAGKLSKDAQKAYADLTRLVWPAKRTLDAAAEAKLLAKFKGEGIGLYPGGERYERAQRLATEAVTD